jgi:cytochrome c peroxidase
VGKPYTPVALCILVGGLFGACAEPAELTDESGEIFIEEFLDRMPNNVPIPNAHGFAASYSTQGYIDLDGEFFQAQGTNGRHCGTCHAPEDGWGINGPTVTALFLLTGGTHPIFASNLDTDTPTSDMSTVQARWSATTMVRKGMFTRKVAVPASRDYDVVAIDDPFGVSTPATLFWFRRPQPTANFRSATVMSDGALTTGTDLREGLVRQARGNITGAQQGQPPTDEVLAEVVDYEMAVSHAQLFLWDVGRLDAGGARGGPAAAAAQPLVAGRFDLYDAWKTSGNAKRRQIWRGQELFNEGDRNGRRCGGCHNAANNGQNVNGALFDVGASRPEFATPDMAVFTFQSRVTGELVVTTDPGQGIRNGQFARLGRFKTPNIRGLAARAPYFHNGISADLPALVRHYEIALGFDFTPAEEADLVAFLKAL